MFSPYFLPSAAQAIIRMQKITNSSTSNQRENVDIAEALEKAVNYAFRDVSKNSVIAFLVPVVKK